MTTLTLEPERATIWAECLKEARRWLCQGCANDWPLIPMRWSKHVPTHHRDPAGNSRQCNALALRRAVAGRK